VKAVADPFRGSTQGWLCHASASLTLLCLAWLHFFLVLGEPDSDRVCAKNASEDCPEIGAPMLLASDVQPESQPEPRCQVTVVFDNLVVTMKQRIAQVVASSWARGKWLINT